MHWRDLQTLEEQGIDLVVVTVIAARGSVPADPGAKMLVTPAGRHAGTVGGGKIESRAISEASALLPDSTAPGCMVHCWNLQRDIGMTCGGEMTLLFELHRASPPWRIFIFGAGHVAQALVPVLLTLACRIVVFENRRDWLEKLPDHPQLTKRQFDSLEQGVGEIPSDGIVVSITQGHATDLPVLREIFRMEVALPFVGVIGSASKRAALERDLRQAGISESRIKSLICPLGLPVGGNQPGEIAISIAAQLLQIRDISSNNR